MSTRDRFERLEIMSRERAMRAKNEAEHWLAEASQCSASFLARMARSRDMISSLSNRSLVDMGVTNSCPSLVGSLSMPTYDVVTRLDTFVSLFLNVADCFRGYLSRWPGRKWPWGGLERCTAA